MITTHDPEHGLSYIYLVGRLERGSYKYTIPATPSIMLDFDAAGALIGIELLADHLLHPWLKAGSVKPGDAP